MIVRQFKLCMYRHFRFTCFSGLIISYTCQLVEATVHYSAVHRFQKSEVQDDDAKWKENLELYADCSTCTDYNFVLIHYY